ncbi:hypothetical protein WA1_01030 [Scytonema hofmannii PCC 7110]|uniref:Uncharacterized protein n=1 Tax=Scytonema hofmannii PCC 7110 TaxID=128403 RepID=A0A139XGG4_9CYAN|nr:hypothetical protein [Scytonema hofmannii]KYC43780.1 hypothetical protein WA1_01030 [Scytonema hofmannii PCC 7110]
MNNTPNVKALLSIFCIAVGGLLLLRSCHFGKSYDSANYTIQLTNNQQLVKSTSETKASIEVNPKLDKAKADNLTNTAKFLAGIQVENNPLAQFQQGNNWQSHQQFFNNAWSNLEIRQLQKVRNWSQQELNQINSTAPSIFYPFSGPDFLYAYSLFPQGNKYVLVGLEPVGIVPNLSNLSESQLNLKLQEIRSSLYAILQFSFFMTNDMKVDLRKQGVLPILYVFLARTQNRITNLQYIGLDKNADIKQYKKGMIPGVKINFVAKGEERSRTLYYFAHDLSNSGVESKPEFSRFITNLGEKVTYLKAASYLMYNDGFSDIRKQILAQSSHILQDDSGMPLTAFNPSKWNLKFYGSYSSPIGLFANRYQPSLRRIYRTNKSIEPLDFGIGYKYGANNSNLMLAEVMN